jgi:hypothetical protein
LNSESPEYKAAVLFTRLRNSLSENIYIVKKNIEATETTYRVIQKEVYTLKNLFYKNY